MSHQRIIGLLVIVCLFLLVLPFIGSEHKIENPAENDPEIIVPAVNTDSAKIREITIEKYEDVPQARAPAGLGEKSDLKAPEIASINKKIKSTNNGNKAAVEKSAGEPRQKGWFVQIASLKESNPIKIESLKFSLKKLGVEVQTERVTVKNIRFIRIKTKSLPSRSAAIKKRDLINEKLKYKRIQAIVRKQ